MAKRLKTLFGVRGVGHIQVFAEKDGKRTLVADIYYKAGEVHVINHDKGWNLVTKGKEAYEWETGDKEGLITKLNDEDLIDYLLYLTDPSCIMTCLYHSALTEPGKFLPPKEVERGLIERRFKEPVEGFRAVFVSEEPAWLCGFECDDPEGGKPMRMIVSKPESLKEVPAGVFERLKGVRVQEVRPVDPPAHGLPVIRPWRDFGPAAMPRTGVRFRRAERREVRPSWQGSPDAAPPGRGARVRASEDSS